MLMDPASGGGNPVDLFNVIKFLGLWTGATSSGGGARSQTYAQATTSELGQYY